MSFLCLLFCAYAFPVISAMDPNWKPHTRNSYTDHYFKEDPTIKLPAEKPTSKFTAHQYPKGNMPLKPQNMAQTYPPPPNKENAAIWLTGTWTGFASLDGASPIYDYYNMTQTSSTQWTVTCGSNDCAWTNGTGIISSDGTVTVSLNTGVKLSGFAFYSSSECGWTDAGTGSPSGGIPFTPYCLVINWDNSDSWVQLQNISKVHLVFMNHLDVGYDGIPVTGFINNIVNIYFHEYYPRAISISKTLQALGLPQTMVYTTHPWLVSLYLDCPPNLWLAGALLVCPSAADVSDFKEAVQNGVIVWHRGPFNLQPENMDSTLFEYGLSIAADLDKQFSLPLKNTLSQRDVPGMTRGVVPLLVKNNVSAISVGVNGATCNPKVPKAFLWKDPPSGTDIIGLWHSGGYPNNPGQSADDAEGLSRSECVVVRGFDQALCWAFRTDNSGPPLDIDELLNNYYVAQTQFPNSQVVGSTFDNFVNALYPYRSTLPVVTQEFGDVWMQGISSDPLKMAQFRVMTRERASCIKSGQCSATDAILKNASRFLIKPPEHTWGLPGVSGFGTWDNANLQANKNQPGYVNSANSWYEQRVFNDIALSTIQTSNTPLYKNIMAEYANMQASIPDTTGYKIATDYNQVYSCNGIVIGFDGKTGGINQLIHEATSIQWASQTNQLARLIYDTYREESYELCSGVLGSKGGSNNDGAQTKTWYTTLKSLWTNLNTCSYLVEMTMDNTTITNFGGAPTLWLSINTSTPNPTNQAVTLDVSFQWFNKTATLFAESWMLAFEPTVLTNYDWVMDLLGTAIGPYEVINGGAQQQHAVWDGVKYFNKQQTSSNFNFSQYASTDVHGILVSSKDVPLVSPITDTAPATPLTNIVDALPGTMRGFAWNLYNNIWTTNYIFWYPYRSGDENQKLRFQITVS